MPKYLRDLWQKPLVLLLLTFAGATGAIGFVAINARRTFADFEAASRQRQGAYEFLIALRLLRQHTGEARVGVTGYVLTHDSAYKATYVNGIAGFKSDTAALRTLARGQPTLERTLDRLQPALLAYQNSLALTLEHSERQSIATLERDLQQSRDFVLLDGLRVIFVALESEQKRLLELGATDVSAALLRSRTIITIATALGALLVVGAGGILLVQIRARERISHDLVTHEQQLSSIYDTVADALFQLAVEEGTFRFVSVNRAFLAATGLRTDQVVGCRVEDVLPGPSLPRALVRFKQAVSQKRIVRWEDISAYPAGTITVEMSVAPQMNAAGNCTYLVGVMHDTTDRIHAEAALRESEERFREMAAHINEAFFIVDLATRKALYVSPTWATIWGRPIEDGYHPDIWFDSIYPDDRAQVRVGQVAVANGDPWVGLFRIIRPDGAIRWIRGRTFPVRDAMGQVHRLAGISEDITEQREAEERTLQAQKMEAVGRLAGGVAHDFNNLLTVILGHADVALLDSKPESQLDDSLREIQAAARRAAALTRQLLAFARQQVVDPIVFSPNEVTAAFAEMARRLIGENIQVVARLAPDARSVKADRGQFEQVLMNLVLNGRDAMPTGGTLTLETSNVTLDTYDARSLGEVGAGEYVVLSVADTGTGMSDAVKARVFEPFFTTKEPGKGTGLGLATSYGIAKQAGGMLTVQSAPGTGSTFRIYLPRVD